MARPRLFSIPAGAPFLRSFVDALLAGAILPDIGATSGPLALGGLTIYTPTRRAGRALAGEFARRAQTGALLLPRIQPLGAPDEEQALFGVQDYARPLAPPVGDIERRLLLADLVLAWTRALSGAILGATPDGALALDPQEALMVGATPADSIGLAGQLAALIDEFLIEDIAWSRIDALATDEHSFYWGATAQFLNAVIRRWPDILAERGRMEAVARRNALIESDIKRIEAGQDLTPTIVLGSTGANRMTARLMRAICHAPHGAVVLPGLDTTSPADVWAMIAREDRPLYTHPQAVLARLLKRLNVPRENVREIGASAPDMAARMRFLAAALAPGEATIGWRDWREAHGETPMLEGVSVVETADEREEALTIALRLRAALETPGLSAALVAPDRAIARRVRAELKRWDVDIDDSGGEALSVAPAGALARAVLDAAADDCADMRLTALLAHHQVAPLAARADTLAVAQALELGVLRATFHDTDARARIAKARAAATHRFAHRFARSLSEEEWRAVGALLTELLATLAPLREGPRPLAQWIARHRAALARLRGPTFSTESADADEQALQALFDALGAGGMACDLTRADYRGLFERLLAETVVRGPQRAHPRVKILGLLEARLIEADLVVLAGLEENVWPPQAEADAFLNRPMRAQLGLPPPERRIGQSAHDFTMAMGAREVFVVYALKRGGAPTVASRFVQRLATLGGAHWRAALARGEAWRALARRLDHAERPSTLARPEPKPPLALRPARLSVTRIETLRRDPYAIYAERILELQKLGDLDSTPGASDLGDSVHDVLATLARDWPSGSAPVDLEARLKADLRLALKDFFADPGWRAFRWPQIEAGLAFVLDYERARRADIARIDGEVEGALDLTLADGSLFRLSARADRIETLRDGTASIVDYKTGAPPSRRQVKAGFASQLTLEAAMLARGAFAPVGARAAQSLLYLKFGGREGGALHDPVGKEPLDALVAAHWAQLHSMLDAFRNPDIGYRSRPYVQFASRFGDYDHLARVKEWGAGGGDES